MTQRKRRWRLSILALALALLPLGALAAPGPVAAGDSLLALLPAGAETVVVLDVARARSSPLFESVLAQLEAHPRSGPVLRRVLALAGLDPRRDLDRVLLASQPRAGTRLRGFVVLEGRIDPRRLAARLGKESWLKPVEVAGQPAWRREGRGSVFDILPLGGGRLAFVHPSLAEALLRQAGKAGGPAPPGAMADAALAGLFARPSHQEALWFAGRMPPELRGDPDAGPLAQAEAVFGTASLGESLQLDLTGSFTSDVLAQQLAAALMLLKPRLLAHPRVKALGVEQMVQRLQAVPQGREARVQLEVPPAELRQVIDRAAGALPLRAVAWAAATGRGAGAKKGAAAPAKKGSPPRAAKKPGPAGAKAAPAGPRPDQTAAAAAAPSDAAAPPAPAP